MRDKTKAKKIKRTLLNLTQPEQKALQPILVRHYESIKNNLPLQRVFPTSEGLLCSLTQDKARELASRFD